MKYKAKCDINVPLVSIIIPAYNSSDVILRTLYSIKQQTYLYYEIIVINDGSTDNTLALIENYQKQNPNQKLIIYSQPNQGVSIARNKGIQLAEGDLICFLDSDDTYEPTFLKEMVVKITETNAQIVYCGQNNIHKNKKMKKGFYDFPEGKVLKYYLSHMFSCSCFMINKEFIDKNQIFFPEKISFAEDLIFIAKLLIKTEIYSLSKCLFNYHYRANSVTHAPRNIDVYLAEIQGYELLKNVLYNEYFGVDRDEVLNNITLQVLYKKLEFMKFCLKIGNYKVIRNYLSKNDLIKMYYDNYTSINKSKSKIYHLIKDQKTIRFMIGTLYYKFLRRSK